MLQQMGFLWAVTAVVWLATLAFIVRLVQSQHRLHRELEQLERALQDVRRSE
ncbi:MAG: CcmD family protein [Alicyclobacillus sp.]|nr:CcmD family protein [Alicyclobacillus sp.]